MPAVTQNLTESHWPASEDGAVVRETTLGDLLREAAAEVPERVALVDAVPEAAQRREWTYAEFLADAERVARSLLRAHQPGDRIALWAPNGADWLVCQQGISLAGMVLVAVNPAYRAQELQYVLGQSRASALIYTEEYRGFDMNGVVDEIREQVPDLRTRIPFAQWQDFLESGDPETQLPDVGPYDTIQIQYTSGTTGFPKGAKLHHMGLVNEATFVAERAGMGDGGVNINAMPMYHIGGGAVTSFGAVAKKGTFVVLPGFDPGLMLECFESYRGTHTLVVPTMLTALLEHPDSATRDLSSIQTIMSGAAAVPASLVRRTIDALDCRFSILFGQTEMHGVISQTRLTDDPEDQANTVGQALPRLEVKIADIVTGEVMPLGEQGEICCRGYQTMIEYYQMADATAATIDEDGWLHMGDLGEMDARGFIRVTGRLKDMIIRGGINIYPREIEEFLHTHPLVAEAVVIGVPDERWGEQIAAVVRLVPGAERPGAEEMRAFCRDNFAAHKAPYYWTFAEELPMTPTGKVQKFVLREQFESGAIAVESTTPKDDNARN